MSYKVKDITLADFGRKEIAIAEKFAEMEGLAAHGRSASSRRSK